eukprot:763480-Hanusia_phi.AAC.5
MLYTGVDMTMPQTSLKKAKSQSPEIDLTGGETEMMKEEWSGERDGAIDRQRQRQIQKKRKRKRKRTRKRQKLNFEQELFVEIRRESSFCPVLVLSLSCCYLVLSSHSSTCNLCFTSFPPRSPTPDAVKASRRAVRDTVVFHPYPLREPCNALPSRPLDALAHQIEELEEEKRMLSALAREALAGRRSDQSARSSAPLSPPTSLSSPPLSPLRAERKLCLPKWMSTTWER